MPSLNVIESGTVGAPTIVFLHGAGTGTWMWQGQIEAFQDFHCLNVELPGHGESAQREWLSFADSAAKVAEMIERRATQRRAHIVGLSLGGIVALELLALSPAHVEAAVLSGVVSAPMPNKRFMRAQFAVISRLKRYRWFSWLFVKSMRLPDEITPVYIDSLQAMARTAFVRIGREVTNFVLPAALSAVQTPVLVSAGGAEAAPMRDAVRHIPTVMPCAKGVLAPGLHHGWNGEDPALFSAMARAWITGAPLPSALEVLA